MDPIGTRPAALFCLAMAPGRSRFSMAGKTAMITGASSGFGAHFARVLADEGAQLVLAARREDRLVSLADELRSRGAEVVTVVMDVADRASIIAAFDQAEAALGNARVIDVLINNAGIAKPNLALRTTAEEFDELMGTNLRGAFFVAQEVCTRLVAAGKPGCVVNISSILGQRPGAQQSTYGAAKAALDQLTRVLALELSRNHVRVNGLAPGYFATEMNADFFDTERGRRYIDDRFVTKRLGALHELDGALLLLASDAGSFISGQTLAIDGGHLQSAL